MTPEQIIKRPIALTEKAANMKTENKITFEVARSANKIEIKTAVEALFESLDNAAPATWPLRKSQPAMRSCSMCSVPSVPPAGMTSGSTCALVTTRLPGLTTKPLPRKPKRGLPVGLKTPTATTEGLAATIKASSCAWALTAPSKLSAAKPAIAERLPCFTARRSCRGS